MSTKNIIKLAQKFENKYALESYAEQDYEEAKRIQTTLSNRFPEYINDLKKYNASVTLTLDFDTGFVTMGKIVVKDIKWTSGVNDAEKKYLESFIPKLVNYLNSEGFKFQGPPWDVTLPAIK